MSDSVINPRQSYLICPFITAGVIAAGVSPVVSPLTRCIGEQCALWAFCKSHESTRQEDIEEQVRQEIKEQEHENNNN